MKVSLKKNNALVKRKHAGKTQEKEKKTKSKNLSAKVITSPFRGDVNQTATLIRVGRLASINAIRESKVLGLDITYMENGVLFREYPDGTKLKIEGKRKPVIKGKIGAITLKKGLILHAGK